MSTPKPSSPVTDKPGPAGWPYSDANAKANNIIWRLCKGVSPQQIYDALDAEGLAIVEKPQSIAFAQASPLAIENAQLRNTIQLHAGDAMSLSRELDDWRERALAAEEALSALSSTDRGGK